MSHQSQSPPVNTTSATTASATYRPTPTPTPTAPIPPPQYPTQYAYSYAQYSPYQHPGYAYQYYHHPHPATTPSIPPPTYKPGPALPTLALSNPSVHVQSRPQSQSQAATTTTKSTAPSTQTTTQTSAPTRTVTRKTQSLKGTFNRELRMMMYAFGDSKEPASDSVDVMEEILIEYLTDVCHTALTPTRKTRVQIEDLRRALSRFPDGKKLARLEELLFMQDDIRRARKQFNTEDDQVQAQLDLQ
ncbi:hypothetical protein Clacol_006365 [Clathrus columnatus]|uniref:Transcription initiation factor TFIID subunit 13 n=1 Tax=Clathrus columnatus TaxID=1419009 RepID=A0AAV5AG26_9AGAM|nr:hypothetical protein Clacol_006365 [Clathrus columnatus]